MNTKTTPKDFFLHLGATIALYASAIALINLAFESINRALPDALSNYWSANSIVWPISMLIVLIPVLYIIEWVIRRDISKIVEKKDIWIRKWRIYLTLFLTGATIVGDFIVLINTYLNGEISSRFIYKVLIVLVVSAVIFAYYLLERMGETLKGKKWKMILAWLSIILVIVGIISGFVIVGSPSAQRALRFDQLRIDNLTNIQNSVAHYWQEFGKVPDTLSTMQGFMSGVPKDPVTYIEYRYEVGSKNNTFIICATFSASSTESNINYPKAIPFFGSNYYDWTHGIGEVCFNRVISPVDFPPVIQK